MLTKLKMAADIAVRIVALAVCLPLFLGMFREMRRRI